MTGPRAERPNSPLIEAKQLTRGARATDAIDHSGHYYNCSALDTLLRLDDHMRRD